MSVNCRMRANKVQMYQQEKTKLDVTAVRIITNKIPTLDNAKNNPALQ